MKAWGKPGVKSGGVRIRKLEIGAGEFVENAERARLVTGAKSSYRGLVKMKEEG